MIIIFLITDDVNFDHFVKRCPLGFSTIMLLFCGEILCKYFCQLFLTFNNYLSSTCICHESESH